MAFISLNSRVVEHRTRLVCLGETPSPRVRCLLAMFTYLLTRAPPRPAHASLHKHTLHTVPHRPPMQAPWSRQLDPPSARPARSSVV
jgi:hypothetical protein